MATDYTKTSAGESATFWHAELKHARKVWDKWEPIRKELRQLTSDYEMDRMFPEELVIDQVDYHILPRFVDRLKGMAGDEKPEVRLPRDMRGLDERGQPVHLSEVGEIQDRLCMRLMSQAGAPEEYEEGMGAICVDGITAFWWEMTGLPDQEEEAAARLGSGEITEAAGHGRHDPSRLQDHEELARGLTQAGASDPEAVRTQAVMTPDGGPAANVAIAGARHADELAKEEKGYPHYWRDGKFRLKCTRYPYGDWFLMESRGFRHKDVRWVARLIPMELEEAQSFEGFRPSVRKDLEIESFDDTAVARTQTLTDEEMSVLTGRVMVWHILDKKEKREYFLPKNGDKFLADRPAPGVDENGRSFLKPVDRYGGFFPVSLGWGKKGTRDDVQKLLCVPLALPGLKGQKIIVKMLSWYVQAVKEAAAAFHFVDEDIFDEHQADFEEGVGGVYPRGKDTDKSSRPPMEVISWKPPPMELFASIEQQIIRTLNDLDFPVAEFTSQPVAKTATQEKMAEVSGSRSAFEITRHMEVSYAVSAHIAMQFAMNDMSDAEIDALIGKPDRIKLRHVWNTVGRPVELPEVEFAAKSRNKDIAMGAQMLGLHQQAKAEVDPLTGAPKFSTEHVLQEAVKRFGLGPLPPFSLSEEQKVVMAKAKMMMAAEQQAQEQGQPAANGKTRDSQGKPRTVMENKGTLRRGRDGGRLGAEQGSAQNLN